MLPIFDRQNWQISDSKIISWYTALSYDFPTDRKSKVCSSYKCNNIFGQFCRENVWTQNKTRHFVTIASDSAV